MPIRRINGNKMGRGQHFFFFFAMMLLLRFDAADIFFTGDTDFRFAAAFHAYTAVHFRHDDAMLPMF